MLQQEIDQAVARATGECICEIARLGFTLANPADVEFDPEPSERAPLVIDWDSTYVDDELEKWPLWRGR